MATKSELKKIIREIIKEESAVYNPDNLGHTESKWYKKSLDKFAKGGIDEDNVNESLSAVTFQITGDAYKQDARDIALQLIKDYKIRKFNKLAKEALVKQLKPKWKKGKTKIILDVDDILTQQALGGI